jgi:hypothetical protein
MGESEEQTRAQAPFHSIRKGLDGRFEVLLDNSLHQPVFAIETIE